MAEPKRLDVQLGNDTITLQAPKSMALRMDVWATWGSNPVRAMIAALAMCWRSPGRPKAKLASVQYNIFAFSELVADELAERGYDAEAMATAGQVAFTLCVDGIVGGQEVDEAENF
jgi:hypothetical protein